jgi:hypothetical protein
MSSASQLFLDVCHYDRLAVELYIKAEINDEGVGPSFEGQV